MRQHVQLPSAPSAAHCLFLCQNESLRNYRSFSLQKHRHAQQNPKVFHVSVSPPTACWAKPENAEKGLQGTLATFGLLSSGGCYLTPSPELCPQPNYLVSLVNPLTGCSEQDICSKDPLIAPVKYMRHLRSVFKTTCGMALCYHSVCQSVCAGPCMCASVHTRMCSVDAGGPPWMLLLGHHYHPPCFEVRTFTGWGLTKNGLGAQVSAYLCLLCTNLHDHFFPPTILYPRQALHCQTGVWSPHMLVPEYRIEVQTEC